MKIQYPRPLRQGATVGLIAPSGAIRSENGLGRAIDAVKAQGFHVKLGESCGQVRGYLSGTDDVRALDINRMFADDEVEGIFCIRGGYGAPRILSMLDYDNIKKHPKPFLGYSDVTALHVALLQKCALASFHGPMPVSDWIGESFDPFSMEHLRNMLMRPVDGFLENPTGYDTETVTAGAAEGLLAGGNLTLIAGLCGTPWALDARGKILFLEEVGEKTYHLDHLLTQLASAGLFRDCAGVVFGQFTDCPIEYPDFGLSLREIIRDVVEPFGKPTLLGLRAGHCQPSLTLPLGARCALDAGAKTLRVLFDESFHRE